MEFLERCNNKVVAKQMSGAEVTEAGQWCARELMGLGKSGK
jgi:hypothetical protein